MAAKSIKKDKRLKKYNLTKDGKLTITSLPMGIYELVETKTLDGLVLDTTKYEVKSEQKDLTTKVYTEKLNISNNTTLVEFSKTDVTGDKELKGAKLTVLDSENNVIATEIKFTIKDTNEIQKVNMKDKVVFMTKNDIL